MANPNPIDISPTTPSEGRKYYTGGNGMVRTQLNGLVPNLGTTLEDDLERNFGHYGNELKRFSKKLLDGENGEFTLLKKTVDQHSGEIESIKGSKGDIVRLRQFHANQEEKIAALTKRVKDLESKVKPGQPALKPAPKGKPKILGFL